MCLCSRNAVSAYVVNEAYCKTVYAIECINYHKRDADIAAWIVMRTSFCVFFAFFLNLRTQLLSHFLVPFPKHLWHNVVANLSVRFSFFPRAVCDVLLCFQVGQ